MKASDLRIGNYLDYYGQTCIVLELLKNDYAEFGYFTDSIGFNRKLTEKHSPKPIPLTEQWLLDFGFKNTNDAEHPNYIKGFYKCMWRNGKTNICNNHGFIKDLSYVHELQNLYFALTNKELTTNQ